MLINSLIDFYFESEKSNYMTVRSYGACWIEAIKDNQKCLNKQKLKDSVVYLLWNCFSSLNHKVLDQIISIPIRTDLAPFLITDYFIQFVKVSGWMKWGIMKKQENFVTVLGLFTIWIYQWRWIIWK